MDVFDKTKKWLDDNKIPYRYQSPNDYKKINIWMGKHSYFEIHKWKDRWNKGYKYNTVITEFHGDATTKKMMHIEIKGKNVDIERKYFLPPIKKRLSFEKFKIEIKKWKKEIEKFKDNEKLKKLFADELTKNKKV